MIEVLSAISEVGEHPKTEEEAEKLFQKPYDAIDFRGVNTPSYTFLKRLKELCIEHNTLPVNMSKGVEEMFFSDKKYIKQLEFFR